MTFYELLFLCILDSYKFTRLTKQICKRCKIQLSRVSFNRDKCSHCSKNLIYECKKCSKQFDNSNKIVSHLRYKCAPERKYYCNACEYKCYVKNALLSHINHKHHEV